MGASNIAPVNLAQNSKSGGNISRPCTANPSLDQPRTLNRSRSILSLASEIFKPKPSEYDDLTGEGREPSGVHRPWNLLTSLRGLRGNLGKTSEPGNRANFPLGQPECTGM